MQMSANVDGHIHRVLQAARWAPSGDNTQPWRFEVRGAGELIVHGRDTRDWCVYDLQGRASQIAVGALLETISIAASQEGLSARFELTPESTDTHPMVRVLFVTQASIAPDPLGQVIEKRCTQRRPLAWKALETHHRDALERSPGPGYRLVWLEGLTHKASMSKLLFLNAKIRLTIQEAYAVHRRIIQWDAGFSEDRIPDRALGLNPVAVRLMKWAMQSWTRVEFLNRYLAGTLLPRIELDLLPGLGCAAHFFLVAEQPPSDLAGYLGAGRAMQRLWLTATALGLQFQPEMTPLIFSHYTRDAVPFTRDEPARGQAAKLRKGLGDLIGADNLDASVFAGRIGYGPLPRWRSLRLPVERLLLP